MQYNTIYLAGGMKSSWQDVAIQALPPVEFVDPRKHGLVTEAEYTAWDLAGIRRSDLVLAFMDTDNPSGFGLSLEVGYAHALGIPVWYVCEDLTPRQRFFGMVRAVAARQFDSLQAAVKALGAA